jgi:hypothetical protein
MQQNVPACPLDGVPSYAGFHSFLPVCLSYLSCITLEMLPQLGLRCELRFVLALGAGDASRI